MFNLMLTCLIYNLSGYILRARISCAQGEGFDFCNDELNKMVFLVIRCGMLLWVLHEMN